MSGNNRGLTIPIALIVGAIIGLFAGLYIAWTVIPLDVLFKDIPPRLLKTSTEQRQYQTVYVSQIAARFHARGGSPAALEDSWNALGVKSGDATVDQAIDMARNAYEVARRENAADGDGGWFTVADQTSLKELTDALEQAKANGTISSQVSALDSNRFWWRLAGLAGLLLLMMLGGFLVYVVSGWDRQSMLAPPAANVLGAAPVAMTATAHNAPFPSSVAQTVVPIAPAPPAGYGAAPAYDLPDPIQAASQPVYARPVNGNETQAGPPIPTVYVHGNDQYDEGFPINGPMSDLVGECGVSIAERIGIETPAKVCALAVWVFDKNDFRSVTKVLMTDLAFKDPVIRPKLSARGEPVLAQPSVFDIDTATLRVEVSVSDLQVNPGGYFDKVSLTFNIYRKG